MVYTSYYKLRILHHYYQGQKPYTIYKTEGLQTSRRGVSKFIKKYVETGMINRRSGSSRPTVITGDVLKIVEEQMRVDDETTAMQLYTILHKKGYPISLRTILRCRVKLGWTFRGAIW